MTANSTEIQPAFLRPKPAAFYLSISRRHLSNLTRRGVLPVIRTGKRCTLYARADLDKAMQRFRRAAIGE